MLSPSDLQFFSASDSSLSLACFKYLQQITPCLGLMFDLLGR